MKSLSIYTLTRNQSIEHISKLERQLSGRKFPLKIRTWEWGSMRALAAQLEMHMQEVYSLRFFYSFQIPRLGKEFDLLQIKDNHIVNIELKSGVVSDQAIRKQLIQNRYYLSVLGRPIQSYTYISSQNRLVRLTHHDHIVDADWERLCEDLQKEGTNYEGNIEDLFRAELYLISPITDPVRFLKKEYFLTSQQRDIEKKILRDIYAKQSGCFWFSGIPGTGKTLLLYDIAMKLSVRHRICMVHCEENGEKWLMTTPYFQIALNRDLTKDETRRQKAMKVLNTMLSEDAQNRIIYDGQDLLSYSQDVDFRLTEYLKDVKPVIEENHMYIRIASNDFFSISRDVVSKMISGEYNAEQAYQSFNSQLLEEKSTSEDIVLDSKKTYSNRFHTSGGNEAYSVMANTLRGIYGTDVLIATGNSFTGNVLKAGYTEKMAGNMIMPNELSAYSSEMSGAELKETVRNFVEGYQGGFIPFNRGSLPVFSGISVEIRETDNGYTLSKVSKNGKQIQDKDTFTVTCLAAPQYMEAYPAEENIVFDGGDTSVEDTWTTYVSDGNAILAEPEDYITLR